MQAVERFIQFFTRPWVMLIYGVGVLGAYCFLDKPLALGLYALDLTHRCPPLVWLTELGRSVPWLVGLPVIALFFRYLQRVKQRELRVWFVWVVLFLSNSLCFVLKNILGRARPERLIHDQVFGFYGYHREQLYHSFPSGHSTLVTALGLSLALLYPRYRWGILLLAIAILATRVLLTYHYLSDVLATCYIGILEYKLLLYIVAQQNPLYWKRLGVR